MANFHLIGHQSTLGKAPRNFSIDPSGKFLLCENQNSDEIVIFKRNINTGFLPIQEKGFQLVNRFVLNG